MDETKEKTIPEILEAEGLLVLDEYKDDRDVILYLCNWDGIVLSVTRQFLERYVEKLTGRKVKIRWQKQV